MGVLISEETTIEIRIIYIVVDNKQIVGFNFGTVFQNMANVINE